MDSDSSVTSPFKQGERIFINMVLFCDHVFLDVIRVGE